MIIFLLLIISVSANNHILENYLFVTNITNSDIILHKHFSNSRPIIIKYINIFEENDNNKKHSIIFNETSNNIFDEYNSLISIMNNDLYFEVNYKNTYSISNAYYNALHVSFYIKNFKFQNMKNNIILGLSFNSPINYDGKYLLEIENYILTFSDTVNSDNIIKNVKIERVGNYFYIIFPSCNEMYYNFIINYDNYNYI
jgi:hypothetical protein